MITTKPLPHQIEGAQFIYNKKVGVIAAKTGKGKTLVTLAVLHAWVYSKETYAVVFSPVKAYDNVWEQEIKKHSDMKFIRFPDAFSIYKKEGSIDFLNAYDIVLIKYSDVKPDNIKMMELLCRGRVTCYDEAHKLKNPDSKLVHALTLITRQALTKWAITATAIGNDLLDLWGIFHFLDPKIFGTEWEFKKKYCVMEEVTIGWITRYGRKMPDTRLQVVDYKNLDELKAIISQYCWFSSSEDLKVTFSQIEYTITDHEEQVYLEAAKGVLDKEREKGKGFAQRLGDIQRAVDGTYDKNRNLTVGFRSSKYVKYRDAISKILSKDESLILFAEYTDTFWMLYALIKEDFPGVPVYKISGSGVDYNEKTVQNPCIILATMGGTESLNLKFCNHVLCYSTPFSVSSFIQLVGRITRLDSKYLDDLNVYLPMCSTTIDSYKYTYLMNNAALINEVLGHDANLPQKKLEDQRSLLMSELRKELLWRAKKRFKPN